MRSGAIWALVLTSLCLWTPAAPCRDEASRTKDKATAEAAPGRPTVQIRLAPLEDLIANLHYLVKKLGREEEGKQFEEMLKSRTGPKGLEGVDTKKPIGLVGTVNKQLDKSELLFLLPIADEKAFVKFLDGLDYKPKKDKDGAYTMGIENVPFPVLFRFAHGYMYATLKFTGSTTLAAADKLPKPETALAGGSGVVSLALNLGAVPPSVRKALVPAAALQLGNLKDREIPGATERQKELRDGLIDEVTRLGKLLIDNGASLRLRLDLDRKAEALSLSADVTGPEASPLGKDIAAMASRSSLGPALLGKDSVVGGYVNMPIPAGLRKLLDPVVDELFVKNMKDLDKGAKELIQPIAEAVKPTLKAGAVVGGADLRGPNKGGKYTVVSFLRLKEGDAVEKALRNFLDRMPAEQKTGVKADVAKVGDVNVHQIDPKGASDDAVKTLGKEMVYVAFRKDALFLTGGAAGLAAMKSALATKAAPGQLLDVRMAISRLAGLVRANAAQTKELSAKAFADNAGDRVRLTLDAGARLDLKLTVDVAVLKFAALLGEEDKKKE